MASQKVAVVVGLERTRAKFVFDDFFYFTLKSLSMARDPYPFPDLESNGKATHQPLPMSRRCQWLSNSCIEKCMYGFIYL
jgi:hypothetical protein